MVSQPKSIDVVTTISLDISGLKFAVVDEDNRIIAWFRWEDRAKEYVKKYAAGWAIINTNPGGSNG